VKLEENSVYIEEEKINISRRNEERAEEISFLASISGELVVPAELKDTSP